MRADGSSGGRVITFTGDDMADAAAGVGVVTVVPGDQMHMCMKGRLPGVGSAIDADVVAVGCELRVDCFFAVLQKAPYRRDLVRRAVENRRHGTLRHNQRVTGRSRIAVADGCGEVVARDPAGLVEKGAVHSAALYFALCQ